MVTKTNFHMLRELKSEPVEHGMLNGEEVEFLRNYFQIEERSDIELQNLRDFVVMYYSEKMKDKFDFATEDLMSGIVGVIDAEKWNRGMEV